MHVDEPWDLVVHERFISLLAPVRMAFDRASCKLIGDARSVNLVLTDCEIAGNAGLAIVKDDISLFGVQLHLLAALGVLDVEEAGAVLVNMVAVEHGGLRKCFCLAALLQV